MEDQPGNEESHQYEYIEVYNNTTTEWSVDNNQNPSSYTSSLNFNGSSDYIDTNYSIASGNKTISFWFNSSYAGYQCIMKHSRFFETS